MEADMGMLGNLVTGTLVSKVLRNREEKQRANELQRSAAPDEYIPAGTVDSSMQGRANAIVGRASQFYRENPTLVHALAATAGAVLLTRLRRR
jgi:hypothetical protein